MKRDMEFVRELLLDFTEGKKWKGNFTTSSFGAETEEMLKNKKFAYHLKIMQQAGLVTSELSTHKSGFLLMNTPELTWEGQDYLSAIESDTVWEKTKATIREKGLEAGQVTFEVFKELAKAKMKETLGLI